MKAGWIDPEAAKVLVAGGTTAFRLSEGREGWVERFGETALISADRDEDIRDLLGELEDFARGCDWSFGRVFGRRRVVAPGASDVPFLLRGDPALPSTEIVRESGLNYEVDFALSYSPGLFPDQRGNRTVLRRLQPGTVLNTFAYTCAFSVAAAAEGAQTVSVDVSKASLQRGRRNFSLNGIATDGHLFVAEDVPTYLARLGRRGQRFDAIILDPPTFGRGGGRRTFRVERDFPELVAMAAALLEPGGSLLLSTNYSAWTAGSLREIATGVLPRGVVFESAPPASDFREGSGSATVWAHLPSSGSA